MVFYTQDTLNCTIKIELYCNFDKSYYRHRRLESIFVIQRSVSGGGGLKLKIKSTPKMSNINSIPRNIIALLK